jgi:hypothetical protein
MRPDRRLGESLPMAFQFLCPQGHLLQGEESLVGQPCQCPQCGVQFLVPPPVGAGPVEPQSPAVQPDVPSFRPEQGVLPQVGPQRGGVSPEELAASLNVPGSAPRGVVHIVCPSGHTLETPREMLGEDAMCPYCQIAFRLRWEDSLEYRQSKEEEHRLREQRLGQAWLQWAIGIAIVVVLGVIFLIAMVVSS